MKLFILKSGEQYGSPYRPRGGLHNKATFVVEMLNKNGVTAVLRYANDNDAIDRLVFETKPDTVFIEALWVVPDKFQVLNRLHPNVRWVVRLHSDIPFLSQEGIALKWISAYQAEGVVVASNSLRARRDLEFVYPPESTDEHIEYLPNYYPAPKKLPSASIGNTPKYLFVGCFGAIRPLKNTLGQAIAALECARRRGKRLVFGINTEGADPQILKNIYALLDINGGLVYDLGRLSHDRFLSQVHIVDAVMQCSLSESFCTVAADAVACGVPLVVSSEDVSN